MSRWKYRHIVDHKLHRAKLANKIILEMIENTPGLKFATIDPDNKTSVLCPNCSNEIDLGTNQILTSDPPQVRCNNPECNFIFHI